MLISTNKFKLFSQKALPLAIASALGVGFYQPAYAADVDLGITKTADKISAALNEIVTYTLTVTNVSTNPMDGTATVTDTLPAGLTYGSSTGADGGTNINGTVTWTGLTLAAGASTTLTVTATVNSTSAPSLSNTASVAVDALLDNDTATGNNTSAPLSIDVLVNLSLCATRGIATLLPGVSVNVWSYATACNGSPTDPLSLGGPILTVNQGDHVKINFTNNLTEPTALLFQGQEMIPDTTGVIATGTKSYLFTATNPGTYLYEAGLLPNAKHQTAMGLYGALVVRPSVTPPNGFTGQAYTSSDTAYHSEAVMVLSEIDTALNNKAGGPASFDMRNFKPKYFLINGKAHPAPDVITLADPGTSGLATDFNLLLRYVNAGVKHHSMATLGLRQQFIANDGNLIANPRNGVSETMGPGQTLDAIATIPAGTVPGSKFPVYDAGMNLNNSASAGMGGMLTFVALGGTAPAPGNPPAPPGNPDDVLKPLTTGVAMTPNPRDGTVGGTVALTATGNDSTTGNSNITSATYSIAGIGGVSGVSMNAVVTPAPIVGLSATIPATTIAGLSEGTHAVTVASTDSADNIGDPSAAVSLLIDRTAPTVSAVSATPNPTNGAIGINSSIAAVRVTATLADATTGSGVASGEMFIDAVGAIGTGIILVPSDGSFNSNSEAARADIPLGTILGLTTGNHTLSVRGRDAAGNWSTTLGTTTLVVDKALPTISSATLTPNNGTVALGAAGSLTLNVTAADVGSGLNGGQYTIDGGTAIPFAGTSAAITTGSLTAGTHALSVRVKDLAGNLSAASPVSLYVVSAVNDPAYTATIQNNGAGNNRVQSISISQASGVLINDQPTGVAGRTVTPVNPVVTRTSGTGSGVMTVALNSNGGFTYTITVPNSVTGTANIRAAKRGTYQFTYTENLNGITSNATVTITVN